MKKTIISLVIVAGLTAALIAGCSINDTRVVKFGGHLLSQTETKQEDLKDFNNESGSLSSFVAFKEQV